jgi:hypothetical protein
MDKTGVVNTVFLSKPEVERKVNAQIHEAGKNGE